MTLTNCTYSQFLVIDLKLNKQLENNNSFIFVVSFAIINAT